MPDLWMYPQHSTDSGRATPCCAHRTTPLEPCYVDARSMDRARDTATLLEGMVAEAVRILESADPSCPGAAIQQALAVLDPGA